MSSEIIKQARDYIACANKELAKSEYFIDETLALKVVGFVALLRHTGGKFAGHRFALLPFQIKFLIDVIATLNKKSLTRRYKTALLFLPRKNGKTELIAALLNYFLFADSEQGKEIYCAANETEQAKIIFNAMETMINQDATLSKNCSCFKSTKTIETKSKFKNFVKVLTANASTKDGLKPYVFVYDELHAAKDGELWRVLEEGTINRANPLAIIISTAGYNQNGIMKQKYDYAKQVKAGIIKDDSFYSMIFEANSENWRDEREWIKANPALGAGVLIENLRDRFLKTQGNSEEELSFKTKHLNIWASSSSAWIDDEIWQSAPKLEISDDLEWFGGLDLASVNDITAYVLLARVDRENELPLYQIKPFFWLPESNAQARARRDRVPYLSWINQGFIRVTPGNVIDYDYLRRDIVEINEQFNIKLSAYDRWNSHEIMNKLQNDDGLAFSQYGQGFASMSAPSKEIYSLAMNKRLIHNGNPVLRWMISNVELERDASDNIKPSKKKSREKIDGVVALVMAYAMMSLSGQDKPAPEPSIRFL